MKKYIDADKLIAEIERYKQGAAIARFDNAGENADYFQGKVDLCDDLTHIIDSLQQEQPEVDLDKEIDAVWNPRFNLGWDEHSALSMNHAGFAIARHFYGLRNRALEEAARHVYESWMGGTMDDVRRDMVELGKVLNARKDE